MNYAKVEKKDLPCIRILVPGQELVKFTYDFNVNEVTVDKLKRFVNDVKTG